MAPSILVASDGTPAALGAIRLALELEEKAEAQVELLGVVTPVPVFDAGFLVAAPEGELYAGRQESLLGDLRDQLESLDAPRDRWPIRVVTGVPGPRIVRRSVDLGADLILLGMGRHRPVDRIFGTETALQVIRISHIPVLAVPETTMQLPTSAALGVDFSHFSQQAAREAFSVLCPPWDVHLAHVMSGMEFLPAMSQTWRQSYEEDLLDRMAEIAEGLEVPKGCSLSKHILEGEPGHELLAFTHERGIELLVVGSHGLSFLGRILMGSVSTRLIRDSRVPVLVVPPSELTQEGAAGSDHPTARHPWVSALDQFSQANAGRRTTLEFKNPKEGSHECGKGFPLWGVDFDPRRNRLNIMLGRSGTVEGHLTHSFQDPREVTVERREDGNATALKVRLDSGEVTLRVHRD